MRSTAAPVVQTTDSTDKARLAQTYIPPFLDRKQVCAALWHPWSPSQAQGRPLPACVACEGPAGALARAWCCHMSQRRGPRPAWSQIQQA